MEVILVRDKFITFSFVVLHCQNGLPWCSWWMKSAYLLQWHGGKGGSMKAPVGGDCPLPLHICIDHKAREIMYLVVSICPSVYKDSGDLSPTRTCVPYVLLAIVWGHLLRHQFFIRMKNTCEPKNNCNSVTHSNTCEPINQPCDPFKYM